MHEMYKNYLVNLQNMLNHNLAVNLKNGAAPRNISFYTNTSIKSGINDNVQNK